MRCLDSRESRDVLSDANEPLTARSHLAQPSACRQRFSPARPVTLCIGFLEYTPIPLWKGTAEFKKDRGGSGVLRVFAERSAGLCDLKAPTARYSGSPFPETGRGEPEWVRKPFV